MARILSTGHHKCLRIVNVPFLNPCRQMVKHQVAQRLDEEPPLLSFHHGRADLPDERFGHFPALPEFRGHLVDPLLLASERGE